MTLFGYLIRAVRETVRYKLLVLVLFPILLIMPIVLALAIYWGASFTYEQLYSKVNTDLRVADEVFGRLRQEYLNDFGRMAESYEFRTALDNNNVTAIQDLVTNLKLGIALTYLHVVNVSGSYLYEEGPPRHTRSSPSLLAAAQGQATVNVEIFSAEDLGAEAPFLARTLQLPLIATPYAAPTSRQMEDRGMMIRVIYPIKGTNGKIKAMLDGGFLLNGNFTFVDTIRDLVYGPGSLLDGSLGTVTVFLDDVRISTNVPLGPGERALGTRVSAAVRSKVLGEGVNWIDRAFVVNDWYISAYEPIIDESGKRVGMLYTGYLEGPYRSILWKALAILALMFVTLMLLSAAVAIRGAKSIFKPLERMTNVVKATRAGEEKRIGSVNSEDEIGVLAREFDIMLDLLQTHSQQLQSWADQLEDKVAERTSELERMNSELRQTIYLLRHTRQQLVVAEKLAAIGELTAGVAHEINNPAQVILGNLDILMAEMGPVLAPVQNEVNLIVQQVYRIQDIINNLLQYARPSEYAGYMSDVDVNTSVKDAIKLVQHLRGNTHFSITTKLDASAIVKINSQELQQVLVNLLVNAIHSLFEHDGLIQVHTRDWEVRGVVIDVIDNGCGISGDKLGRIFNPFYTTKGQGEGTGLGLSISYGLIRRYGGNITVQSTPRLGTQFTIWLLSIPVLVEDETMLVEQIQSIVDEAALIKSATKDA